jgi:formate hydrogenlyase subunit 6/NADH:ubiquinone oxidoreductase subunit I
MRYPKLRELKFAVEALIKGPYTSKFPKTPPVVPEHFRGVPTYVPDDCVGCGACGQVCPAGAITVVDEYREDKKRMVRRIERNWGNCIMCSQCFVYCITKKGIVLDKDFDKSTTDTADFIDTQDKELLFCEHCGNPVTTVDHVRWCTDKLGELAYANQTFMVARHKALNLTQDTAPRSGGRPLDRGDFMRMLCPNCRASYILSDEWGES